MAGTRPALKQQSHLPDSVGPSHAASQQREGHTAVRRRVPEYLTIASVLAPWGTRGELKVRIETDFPERFDLLRRVYLGPEHEPYEMEGFRRLHNDGLLKLRDCDNPESAARLRNMEVQIPLAEAMPLPDGQYYTYQIEGLQARTEDGEALGSVAEVLFTGANPILVVRGSRGEVLIPKLPDVVLEINPAAGYVIVRLPAGLLD
jgi:16S rRNA processing protein RimM